MLDIGPEPANACYDRLPVLGVLSDFARKREQSECASKFDVLRRGALGQTRALGFFPVDRFAALDIGPEPAGAHRHFEAGCGIFAELPHSAVAIGTIARCELARVA